MLAESGISVAPLERPRAPDAKHMAPASSNTRSRTRRTEPLAAVVEKSASSDSDGSATDNDNDSGSGENDGGNRDENGSGSDENDSGNRDENDSGDKNDSEDDGDDSEENGENSGEDDNENNAEDDNENNAEDNGEDDSENDSKNNAEDNGENDGKDNGEDNSQNNGKKDNADVPIIPTPVSRPSAIGTPVRGSEPTTAILPVPAIASVAPNPTRNQSPARGGELITAVLPAPDPDPFCTPARGSAVLTAASVAPTPSRKPNQRGSEIPTTASAVLALEPSIGKDSGASPTDPEPIGEGSLIFTFVFLSLFIFNLVTTPPMGPLPDNGIKIYFNSTSCFKKILDVKMSSPISLQGASRTTGGILRGNAYGNKLNHADFERDEDPGGFMLIKPKQVFKIFIYVQYGDVLVMSWVPDFASQDPITVFISNAISPLTQPLLEKAAQYHEFIKRKHCIFITVI